MDGVLQRVSPGTIMYSKRKPFSAAYSAAKPHGAHLPVNTKATVSVWSHGTAPGEFGRF